MYNLLSNRQMNEDIVEDARRSSPYRQGSGVPPSTRTDLPGSFAMTEETAADDRLVLEPNGLKIAGKETEDAGKRQGSWYRHRFNPCHQWSVICSWFVHLLQFNIGKLGENIAKHQLISLSICILFVSFGAAGLLWLKVENRTVKLFIPQESTAIKDLNKAEEFFRLKVRHEGIILVAHPQHSNVLAPDCLQEAYHMHNQLLQLKSYSEYCLTLSGDKANSLDDCVTIDPFEVFQDRNFNKKTLVEIQLELNKALNNKSLIMRNGQLFEFNFKQIFGQAKRTKDGGIIISASALQLHYLFSDPPGDDQSGKVLEWEKTFLDKTSSFSSSCFKVYHEAERSTDDAVAENGGAEITLVSVTFTIMISFACLMLSKFRNPLTGHSLLACAGVLAVSLGILAGMGIASWCQVTFVNMVGVVPYLVISIGIDDMFILVDELDREPRHFGVVRTIKEVMTRTGATITMTTLTDLVAFVVSTSSSFPAIRYFCAYAALAVTFSYIMMVTFFVAAMTFDVKRIKAGRRDCLPVCLAPQPKDGERPWDEPRLQTSNRFMEVWAKLLVFPASKLFVLLMSIALLAMGIYGTTKVTERFDRRMLAKDDSTLLKFLTVQEKYYEQFIPVSIVLTCDVKYEDRAIQNEIRKLSDIVKKNSHYRKKSLSWMKALTKFSFARNVSITGPHFMPALKMFLEIPQFSSFKQDVKLSSNGDRVIASRIVAFMKSNPTSTFQKNAMLTIRDDLANKSPLNVFPISRSFIFFEQYAIIGRETAKNLIIAALAVLVVTSLFLIDCSVTIIVVANFVALVLELFGLMYIWGVTLNGVSMITLVMAMGFAVDYSAHIAHAFVMSEEETADKRVVDAVSTLGASVFMGGFSTFLGMLVLVTATSEIYRIFFRMFMGIVLFGLLHGLCILPVQLSLLWWKPAVTRTHNSEQLTKEIEVEEDLN